VGKEIEMMNLNIVWAYQEGKEMNATSFIRKKETTEYQFLDGINCRIARLPTGCHRFDLWFGEGMNPTEKVHVKKLWHKNGVVFDLVFGVVSLGSRISVKNKVVWNWIVKMKYPKTGLVRNEEITEEYPYWIGQPPDRTEEEIGQWEGK